MTDKKIEDLTAITGANLADGDEFVVVDVSDATMDATGTTKKITRAEMARGVSGIKIVDLGVIDFATVCASDPITLYNMQPGEFLSTIRYTDTDAVETDVTMSSRAALGIGTVKSFAWATFAWAFGVNASNIAAAYDTLGFFVNSQVYGPGDVAAGSGINANSMVLSAAAVGPIVVGIFDPSLGATASGVRFKKIQDWASATAYDSEISVTPGTPPLVKAAIKANGTIWVNTGAAGTSGGSSPDFAGNVGSTVADGADIIWTDTQAAIPTVGSFHAVAEIWTPN